MVYTDDQLASFLAKCRKAAHDEHFSVSKPNPKEVRRQLENAQATGDDVEELVREARERGHIGPLIVGPRVRSSDDVRILEELCPEHFGPPRNQLSEIEAPLEPQPLVGSLESPKNASVALPAPLSIPLLPASWWQALLYGSREAMLSPGDANNALRLVARELAKDLNVIEFTDSVRVNTLRKVLDQRFGAGAWPAMNKLWRSAPASPGASQPSEDQGQLPPGPSTVGRNQPRWIGELNEPGFTERAWMIENGLWGG